MEFRRARSVSEAAESLAAAAGNGRILAGGTDLLVQMKSGRTSPDVVIDIKHIPGMYDLERGRDGWRIGAAVSGAQIGDCREFCEDWPGVAEAAQLIGSTQVQGRATLIGNLCNASPAADCVPALIAAGAEAEIEGPDGARRIHVADLPTGPGKTVLGLGEFVAAIHLPDRGTRSADAYLRFIPRTEMDIAVASAGAWLAVDEDGAIVAARVALGAVAATAYAVEGAGDLLAGTRCEASVLETLGSHCSASCSPIDDKRGTVEFRREVAGVLARRAAKTAYDRAMDRR